MINTQKNICCHTDSNTHRQTDRHKKLVTESLPPRFFLPPWRRTRLKTKETDECPCFKPLRVCGYGVYYFPWSRATNEGLIRVARARLIDLARFDVDFQTRATCAGRKADQEDENMRWFINCAKKLMFRQDRISICPFVCWSWDMKNER